MPSILWNWDLGRQVYHPQRLRHLLRGLRGRLAEVRCRFTRPAHLHLVRDIGLNFFLVLVRQRMLSQTRTRRPGEVDDGPEPHQLLVPTISVLLVCSWKREHFVNRPSPTVNLFFESSFKQQGLHDLFHGQPSQPSLPGLGDGCSLS